MVVNFIDSTFGALIPFMQIAFGVNILFSAWDGIYVSLAKFQEKSQLSDEELLSVVDASQTEKMQLDRQRKSCEATRRRFRECGRWGGMAMAVAVGVALLLVQEEVVVGNFWWLIMATGFTMPVLMLIMFFVGRRCEKQVSDEANRIARKTAEAAGRIQEGALDLAKDIQPSGNNQQGDGHPDGRITTTMSESCTDSRGDTWEVYQDTASQWRWRRKARNGQIVGSSSEGCRNKSDCISNARRNGMDCTPQ